MGRAGFLLPLIVLVGDGPNRLRLQDEAARLRLTEHVVFAGSRPHAEVATWMGAADWLLLSSEYEGWPTVYFEAMACGRPVLTSNVSSAKDAICGPEYGKVVEPRTPEAFAKAMMEASVSSYDASAIRAYAELHSWAHWAEATMNVISDAMRRPNA
jgi:glycosyltransferase involved in cell wall biosynthesis